MKIIVLTLMVVVATVQLSQTEVEGAALDTIKDAAKTIGKEAAAKADSVTEVPHTGGVVQTVLHKTASIALDKGVDLLAAKYPIVGKAAPHIKKFSKPMLNAAHTKINNMFETTTVDPNAPTTTTPAPAPGDEKPGLMDKIKGMVSSDNKDDKTEENKENSEAEQKDVKGKRKSHKKRKPSKKNKKDGADKKAADQQKAVDDGEQNTNEDSSKVVDSTEEKSEKKE